MRLDSNYVARAVRVVGVDVHGIAKTTTLFRFLRKFTVLVDFGTQLLLGSQAQPGYGDSP